MPVSYKQMIFLYVLCFLELTSGLLIGHDVYLHRLHPPSHVSQVEALPVDAGLDVQLRLTQEFL